MELKYVGAKPMVSQHGVSFDQKEQDSYVLLHSVVELLEVLSSDASESQNIDITGLVSQEYRGKELLNALQIHCKNLKDILVKREEKTELEIKKYTQAVINNTNISEVERDAWLGNIRIMEDYYRQFITNEFVYNEALNALEQIIEKKHIQMIKFDVGRNYALVLSHLEQRLKDHRLSQDSMLEFEKVDGKPIGKFSLVQFERDLA